MINGDTEVDYKEMQAWFFDLDGCIYHGGTLAEGAGQLLGRLEGQGLQTRFISNNSSQSSWEIAIKLKRLGLPVNAEQIIAATDYAGVFIREQYGRVKVRVIGSEQLISGLLAAGHEVLPLKGAERRPDVVLIGRDTEFTYNKLLRIVNDCEAGAVLIATNADQSHPGGKGLLVPETGAIVAAVETAAGRPGLARYIGKPESYLFQLALKQLSCTAEQSVMVGDNFHTDIAGATAIGMHAIWLRSGKVPAAIGREYSPERNSEGMGHNRLHLPAYRIVHQLRDILSLL